MPRPECRHLLASVAAATIVHAVAAQATTEPAAVPADASAVSLTLTPYAWLTGFTGDAGAKGVTFDVDLSFGDVLDTSDTVFGLMGAIDLEVNRFVFQLNGAYSSAEASGGRNRANSGPLGGNVEVSVEGMAKIQSAWFEALGGYRFVEHRFGERQENAFSLDGFVGARITALELDQTVTAAATITLPNGTVLTGGTAREVNGSQEWVEPFVGLRTGLTFGEHWELIARADVGGFGVSDSDFSWQVLVGGGYRWRFDGWSLGLFGGYRALAQDYYDGEFRWDMITHGPILGLSVRWEF